MSGLKPISWMNRHFADTRRSARLRGFEWKISKKQFIRLVSQNCFYCGVEPEVRKIRVNCRDRMTMEAYHGIDRKDSGVGYEMRNLVPCCSKCNRLKSSFSFRDFLKAVEDIFFHAVLGSGSSFSQKKRI